MEIANTTKRKKRRTRRNLNEIKKRCNRLISNNVSENNNNKDYYAKNNSFVTSNRLTLFNKAVQSETVKRGHFNSLDSKKCIGDVSLKKQNKPAEQYTENDRHNVEKTTITLEDDMEFENTYYRIIENNSIKPGSLDSPNISSSSNESVILCMPNISSSDSQINFELYDEFMDNIPGCLVKCVPELLQNDVMRENIIFLQRKKIEIFEKKNMHSNFQNNRGSLHTNKIIKSPLMPCTAWKESPQLEPSSPGSNSYNSNTSKCLNLSLNNSPIHDSPEYTYYPHRLNQ